MRAQILGELASLAEQSGNNRKPSASIAPPSALLEAS
jgi:hypothetical protein